MSDQGQQDIFGKWDTSDGRQGSADGEAAESTRVHVSTAKGFTPLMLAASNGDIEAARALVAAGVDVNAPGADGTHVLPYAIVRGQVAFALFLLDEGADPNGAMGGVRALHAASGDVDLWLRDWYLRHERYRRYDRLGGELDGARRLLLVKALLHRGADPNARATSSAMFSAYVGYPRKGASNPSRSGPATCAGPRRCGWRPPT